MEREERNKLKNRPRVSTSWTQTHTADEIKLDLMMGDPADRRLDEGAHEAYVVPEGYRGIQETVVGPGRYYVNTLAISPIVIPTTNQTVEWTAGEVANTFNPFEVISKDGFTMQLEVRVVFRVKPEDAPFMVAKIGGIERLIQNVMHPLIDSIFRNQASESSAMACRTVTKSRNARRLASGAPAEVSRRRGERADLPHPSAGRVDEDADGEDSRGAASEHVQRSRTEEKRIQLEKTRAHADNQKI